MVPYVSHAVGVLLNVCALPIAIFSITVCNHVIGNLLPYRVLLKVSAYIYGDNQSVLANTTRPNSVLKKKSQSIAYHFVREGAARDEWRTAYVNTHDNEADLLTKQLPNGEKRRGFVRNLLHHIFSLWSRMRGLGDRRRTFVCFCLMCDGFGGFTIN